MSRLISEDQWLDLQTKALLYDSQATNLSNKYATKANVLISINIGLAVALVIFIVLYLHEKSVKRYLKKCLNLNFGWFE